MNSADNNKRACDGARSSSPVKKTARAVIISTSNGSTREQATKDCEVATHGLSLLANTSVNALESAESATRDAKAELTAAAQEITAIAVEQLLAAGRKRRRNGINVDLTPPCPIVHRQNNEPEKDILAPLFITRKRTGLPATLKARILRLSFWILFFAAGNGQKGRDG